MRHFPYPITMRILNGYIEISAPDFGIIKAKKRLEDLASAEELGKLALEVFHEAVRIRDTLAKESKPLPTPSKPRGALESPDQIGETLLTMREVQKILKVSDETVRRLCKRGVLSPVLTQGRHRRFRMRDIKKHLESIQAE